MTCFSGIICTEKNSLFFFSHREIQENCPFNVEPTRSAHAGIIFLREELDHPDAFSKKNVFILSLQELEW